MATKWKSFSRGIATKTIAFLLCIGSFGAGLGLLVFALNDVNMQSVLQPSYAESSVVRERLLSAMSLGRQIATYQNEDMIRSGKFLNSEEIDGNMRSLYEDYLHEQIRSGAIDEISESAYEVGFVQFKQEHQEELQAYKNHQIEFQLYDFARAKKNLAELTDIVYYFKIDGFVVQNAGIENSGAADELSERINAYFTALPVYVSCQNGSAQCNPLDNRVFFDYAPNSSDVICAGIDPDAFFSAAATWNTERGTAFFYLFFVIGLAALFLITLIFLLAMAGRRSKSNEIHRTWFDKIPMEVTALVALLVVSIVCSLSVYIEPGLQFYFLGLPAAVLALTVVVFCLMSFSKNLKARTFLKNTVLYRLLRLIRRGLRNTASLIPEYPKYILILCAYGFISYLTVLAAEAPSIFLIALYTAVVIYLVVRKLSGLSTLAQGLKTIKAGNLNHKILIPNPGQIRDVAEDVNSITDGLKAAVANEVKSERMKTELITNVSHDIKTPLTSIITYIDLLKNPENTPEQLEQYIRVLDEKSQRLKTLTEDLFEAAKAASGSIPVNYELVDMMSLVTQGLGELDDKIRAAGLEFIVHAPEQKTHIRADGRLLWRVIENMLTNVLKYAMPGSRVYVDAEVEGGSLSLTIKNISNYALNIPADELMERFQRGDESRNSEGSGLGLSIAQDLTELQGGVFRIAIDGDLFKAIVSFPIIPESGN